MNPFFTLDDAAIDRFLTFLGTDTEKAIIHTQQPNSKGDTWCIACAKHIDKGTITIHNLTRPYALEHGFTDIISTRRITS